MSSLLMDLKYKKLFAIRFARVSNFSFLNEKYFKIQILNFQIEYLTLKSNNLKQRLFLLVGA